VRSLDDLLEQMTARGASDLHLKPTRPPLVRVTGRLFAIDDEVLKPEDIRGMLDQVLKPHQRARLDERLAVDFGYGVHGLARFRANVYYQRGTLAAAFRRIPFEIRGVEELNLPPVLLDFCDMPMGMVLVTGPTGSGKSTTLAALVKYVTHRRPVHVVTIEDPMEFLFTDGVASISQREVGTDTPTFAEALRNVMRQDPDVIMVGELRDRETVETAMAAAMTGHLVLSTVHTNDAPSAATRLIDMGAPPWLIAAGLIGILAQRLVRRLCDHCSAARLAGEAELSRLGLPGRDVEVREARGCHRCESVGYRGRVGIHEMLAVDGRIRELIGKGATAESIRDIAREAGHTSLAQHAWQKVRDGLTTLDEVAPLLRLAAADGSGCAGCGGPVRPGWRACPACGDRLRQTCACGESIEKGWRFCPRCAAVARGGQEPSEIQGEVGGMRAGPGRPVGARAGQSGPNGSVAGF
jgi:twitching motility protein PilT